MDLGSAVMVDHAQPRAPTDTRRGLFVVWGPAWKGARSAVLARALGLPGALYVDADWRRGLRSDPMKYPRRIVRTVAALVRHRPPLLLVQSPPTPLTWLAALYGAMSGRPFLIDAHSDAFQRTRWLRPGWLNHLVWRRALAVTVTDEAWATPLRAIGARPIVVPDIPTDDAAPAPVDLGEGVHVAVVNSGGRDEPLEATLEAAGLVPEVTFHVTGRTLGREAEVGAAPANVRFTGYLSPDAYTSLLASADAVMCLTMRDHTMQRGACEALSLGRPIITSDWPLLRSYFSAGTVHVDNSVHGIAAGVRRLVRDVDIFRTEVGELRTLRRAEWDERRRAILALVDREIQRRR
jgi:glycosyltransferase involved in cell wall biosynthesis